VRIVAIVAGLLAVSGAQASQPAVRAIPRLQAPDVPLYGVVWSGRDGNLGRLDPSTLEPVGPALSFREFGAWSFSPGGDRLAVGGSYSPVVRFVDVARLQTLRSVVLGPSGAVERIDWLGPTSAVVLHASPGGTRLAWVNTASGRVLKRARLGIDPFQTASAGGRVVALLPPRKGIGAGRLAVVGLDRRIRIVRLPKIRIGASQPRTGAIFRRVVPGLAVDPASAHAYVVGTDGVVADVDLRSRAVVNHSVLQPRSLAARLGAWLVPSAEAKMLDGPNLSARWLGDGLVAVTGTSYRATTGNDTETQSATPLGLRVMDVRTWTQRMIDASADGFAIGAGALLAYGVRSEWSTTSRSLSGMGVAAYASDGSMRFHVLPAVPIGGVQVNASRAYGWVVDAVNPWHVVVVDVASGTVESELELARPTRLLIGDGSLF
jgi:hypothetical protein